MGQCCGSLTQPIIKPNFVETFNRTLSDKQLKGIDEDEDEEENIHEINTKKEPIIIKPLNMTLITNVIDDVQKTASKLTTTPPHVITPQAATNTNTSTMSETPPSLEISTASLDVINNVPVMPSPVSAISSTNTIPEDLPATILTNDGTVLPLINIQLCSNNNDVAKSEDIKLINTPPGMNMSLSPKIIITSPPATPTTTPKLPADLSARSRVLKLSTLRPPVKTYPEKIYASSPVRHKMQKPLLEPESMRYQVCQIKCLQPDQGLIGIVIITYPLIYDNKPIPPNELQLLLRLLEKNGLRHTPSTPVFITVKPNKSNRFSYTHALDLNTINVPALTAKQDNYDDDDFDFEDNQIDGPSAENRQISSTVIVSVPNANNTDTVK